MTMLDLINPDLSWLSKVHQPDTTLGDHFLTRPFELPAGTGAQTPDGKRQYFIDSAYSIACGAGADVAVKGSLAGAAGLVLPQPPDVIAWAIETFFVTQGMTFGEPMSLDALMRHKDLPDPVLSRCPRCRGKMREPDAEALVGVHATLLDGPDTRGCVSTQPCTRCDGNGRIADFSDGYETIQGVTVDWRALKKIVPHLRGDAVMVGKAPSLHGLHFDLHLRPYVVSQRDKQEGGGAWAVLWAAVPGEAGVVAAA